MSTEQQMNLNEWQVDESDLRIAQLIHLLKIKGWQTRHEIAATFLWNERTIRAVAQAAGSKIVRGQKGFNHVDNASREELLKCAAPFFSQGRTMIKTAIAWKRAAMGKPETQTEPT